MTPATGLKMFLDHSTLGDLEVLSPLATNGPTVWKLVDRTRTRAGRDALRRRLVASPKSAAEIVALQQAHHVLATRASAYRSTMDLADIDGAERYLDSNWQLPSSMRRKSMPVGSLWRGKWYRQYLQDIVGGQTRVQSLLLAGTELRQLLAAADSTVLRDMGERIAALLDRADVQETARLAACTASRARLAFDQLAREVAKAPLTELLECFGTIEAMWSVAVATVEHSWSYPRPGSRLRVTGLIHPFLGRSAVANDLELDDRVRVCFVTGPNMAGKSTFLKAIAIAVVLAHAGCGVPATSMEFPVVGTVFSSVQISDSLSIGESFYLAEIRRIRALAVALCEHKSAVAVVDEPFRGTNVHDAADATLAIVTRLAAHPVAVVFIASHVVEIVPSITDDPRICLLHFAADIAADQPRFEYRLRNGASTQRLGMTLLRQEQVLDLLERSSSPSLQA